ncbi:MAG: DoxX family protein [Chthonomonadales bacterium]|nr:DoxX family protein [Chthonomonadales bacterium]
MTNNGWTSKDRASVDWALLLARLVLGVIFVAHGSQKVFGAFGGSGLSGIVGMVGPIGYLVAIAEFLGGLGLLAGLLPRLSAAALIVDMIGAIALVHGRNGFFLGARPGFEYNLALIGLLGTVLIAGPGRFSVAHVAALPRRRPAAVPGSGNPGT